MHLHTVASKSGGCAACHLHLSCLPPRTVGNDAFGNPHPDLASVVRAKGSFVYRAGEPRRSYYLLRSGSAKAMVADEQGKGCVTMFYFPTDLIGVSSLARERYAESVELLERSSVCELPADVFEQQCSANRDLLRGVFSKMSNSYDLERGARLRLNRVAATARLADFLIEIGARMAALHRSRDKLFLPMSRYDIASHLSLACETVSRAFRRLEDEGVVAVHGRQIEIVSLAALTLRATDNPASAGGVRSYSVLPMADSELR